MTTRPLWAAFILAALICAAGCVQAVKQKDSGALPERVSISSPTPLLEPASKPPQEGQLRETGGETAGSESEPSSNPSVSLGLLIDVSESMREKMDLAVNALQSFINSTDPQDEAFLLKFGKRPILLQTFTDNRSLLNGSLKKMRVTSAARLPLSRGMEALVSLTPLGMALIPFDVAERWQTRDLESGTALYDAVLEGLHLVRQGKHAKKALLIITDGMDDSSSSSLNDVLQAAESAEVPIYSIGIGDPQATQLSNLWTGDHRVAVSTLQMFSEKTKGVHFILNVADAAGSATALTLALDKVSKELRQSTAAGFTYVYNPQLQVFERVPATTDIKGGS